MMWYAMLVARNFSELYELAKNLLCMKMSIEDISKAIGLTLKDIQKLQSTDE